LDRTHKPRPEEEKDVAAKSEAAEESTEHRFAALAVDDSNDEDEDEQDFNDEQDLPSSKRARPPLYTMPHGMILEERNSPRAKTASTRFSSIFQNQERPTCTADR
jgi:hypothetical protein